MGQGCRRHSACAARKFAAQTNGGDSNAVLLGTSSRQSKRISGEVSQSLRHWLPEEDEPSQTLVLVCVCGSRSDKDPRGLASVEQH